MMQRPSNMLNVGNYYVLVSTCANRSQPEVAVKVLRALQREDIVPEIATYNTLISACANGEQPEWALGGPSGPKWPAAPLEPFGLQENSLLFPDTITLWAHRVL